jgi:hypothetical protein
MLVCDVCAHPASLSDFTRCRCSHSFCDDCAQVSCCDPPPQLQPAEDNDEDEAEMMIADPAVDPVVAPFSSCNFCPKCVVECETFNYDASLEISKAMEAEDFTPEPAPEPELEPEPEPAPEPPSEFICPITHEIMTYPVVMTDGFSYEREAAITWLLGYRQVSPMTGAPVRDAIMPNTVLRILINDWKEKYNVVVPPTALEQAEAEAVAWAEGHGADE